MPRVSVIVPVYNVEDYLDECLESLLCQSLDDWEAICVDDGSADESGKMLDQWALRDARIHVIHKENGGLSSARNAGISLASGEIVCFLDSDDYLKPDALLTICSFFDSNSPEVLVFGSEFVPAESATPWLERALSPRMATYDGFSPALAFEEATVPFAWRVACSKSFLLNTSSLFDESVRYGEDVVWCLHVYTRASRVQLIPDKLYCYRLKRSQSLVSSEEMGSLKRLELHVEVLEAVFSDWAAIGFVDRWAAELAAWAMRFCGYAVLRVPSPDRDGLVARLGTVFNRYFPGDYLSEHAARADVSDLIDLFKAGASDGHLPTSSLKLRLLLLVWRVNEYGMRDLVETALGRGGSRSGSGS